MSSSIKKCVLYFVRHGESVGNVTQTLLDRYADKLTENGQIQAKLLGGHFSDAKFDRAYSSDYQRASDTAKIILKETIQPHPELQTDQRLREVNYGVITGRSYKDGLEFIKALNLPLMEWAFPGGGSFKEAGERIGCFVKELCTDLLQQENSDTENILVVTHSMAFTHFLAFLSRTCDFTVHNWTPKDDLKVMKNTAYMKVEASLTANGAIEMTFLVKHFIEHLNNNQSKKEDTGINNLVKKTDSAKEFADCVQQ